ncbi:endonuclease [Flavobacterium enshiense]|uniref:endonuclease n=1 Tax=Flavobacterium enshiense TaxID=1341165 RepID=UPI00345D9A0B
MKKFYTIFSILSVVVGFAQIPTGYYNTATGSGYTLKTQLKNIITTNHSDQGYAALWTLYTQSAFRDNYYENDGSLLDLYSENPTGADPYNYTSTSQQCGNYTAEGQCYNREHLVPQSYFDNFAVDPMKNDPFHVFPSDGKVNGDRNNLPFGKVSTATYTSQNGSKRGANTVNDFSGYSATVFEPLDAFKGDVARAFFYFATRYEDSMDDFYTSANAATCEAKNMFDGSINKVFSDNFILLLIKWHKDDPVSAKEIAQNNAIYNFQGNRNPYIDHPEYVCNIWTTQCATVDLLATDSFEAIANISIYPNPTKNNRININSDVELSEIELININGQIVQQIKKPNSIQNVYTLENLPQGFYFVKLTAADNQTATKKILVN